MSHIKKEGDLANITYCSKAEHTNSHFSGENVYKLYLLGHFLFLLGIKGAQTGLMRRVLQPSIKLYRQ